MLCEIRRNSHQVRNQFPRPRRRAVVGKRRQILDFVIDNFFLRLANAAHFSNHTMSVAAPAVSVNPDTRICCKVIGCPNWTTSDYDNLCVYHINHTLDKKPVPYEDRCKNHAGKFGLRDIDDASFSAVFHPAVFCTDDERVLSAGEQAELAKSIEDSYVVGNNGENSWRPGARKLLFVVMNPGHGERLGAFYHNPKDVLQCVFNQDFPGRIECRYPSDFDFYVIDPSSPAQMDFLVSIMEEKPTLTTSDQNWWAVPYKEALKRLQK